MLARWYHNGKHMAVVSAVCLPDMRGYNFTMIRTGMGKNVLDQIVSVLITCNYMSNQYLGGTDIPERPTIN